MREDKIPLCNGQYFAARAGVRERQGVPHSWGRRQTPICKSPTWRAIQGLVGDLTSAQNAIHVVADQIHYPVAHTHVDLDIRVAGVESR